MALIPHLAYSHKYIVLRPMPHVVHSNSHSSSSSRSHVYIPCDFSVLRGEKEAVSGFCAATGPHAPPGCRSHHSIVAAAPVETCDLTRASVAYFGAMVDSRIAPVDQESLMNFPPAYPRHQVHDCYSRYINPRSRGHPALMVTTRPTPYLALLYLPT